MGNEAAAGENSFFFETAVLIMANISLSFQIVSRGGFVGNMAKIRSDARNWILAKMGFSEIRLSVARPN